MNCIITNIGYYSDLYTTKACALNRSVSVFDDLSPFIVCMREMHDFIDYYSGTQLVKRDSELLLVVITEELMVSL